MHRVLFPKKDIFVCTALCGYKWSVNTFLTKFVDDVTGRAFDVTSTRIRSN